MDDTGGLTPGSRFDRMEASLSRIEEKLDRKVDRTELEAALRRIMLLESGDTPLGKVLLGQFNTMQHQIGELQLHGSAQAQAAMVDSQKLRSEVLSLQSESVAEKAVINASRDRDLRFFRSWAAVCSALSLAAALVAVSGVTL